MNVKPRLTKQQAVDFFLLNLGLILTALGISLFKSPNHFAIGGVSGLAIIANFIVPSLPVGIFMGIINSIFLVLALLLVGKEFAYKTAYSSLMLSFYTYLIEVVAPLSAPLTDETFLELIFAVMLPAAGSAVVFNLNASTGGTDIIAKILSRHTRLPIGQSLLISDFLIAASTGFIFDIKTALFCILGLLIKTMMVDVVIDGINVRKSFMIISDQYTLIERYIIEKLHRGATVHEAYGSFTHKQKHVITTAVSRTQAVMLRDYIKTVDKDAFITIVNSSEIIGKGFRSI